MILLDTNIILRSKQSQAAEFKTVTQKLIQFAEQAELLIVAPQVIYEFYAIVTRPIDQGGLALSSTQGFKEVENVLETYSVLPETGALMAHWLNLIQKHKLKGNAIHDARLVAYMKSHGIGKLYTLNTKDFKKFKGTIDLVS